MTARLDTPRPILTLKQPPPEVGDIWKLVSAECQEFVHVVAVSEKVIAITALPPAQPGTQPLAARSDGPRWIAPSQFNGKKGGYRLHQRKGRHPT